jgi:hypothetical protein
MEYDLNVRHLNVREHVEHLVRDYGNAPRDRRRRGRPDLRKLLGVDAYRRARNAQPARS